MPPEPPPRPAGPRLDSYRLVKRLAVGGMAEVFLAVDERSGRQVALKRILPQIAGDADFRDRFFHEIRIQISLKHRNVVELLDCNPGAGSTYIVMEYIDGGPVHLLRDRVVRLPWEVALHVAAEALRGLGAAHRKGIVHRDVKPANIMWTREGAVKIADFGVSHAEHLTRLTQTGTVVGTPAFMSPEQARGETLDPRSDLFSVGTVLYELLTGTNPFHADSVAVTLRRITEVVPDPPSRIDPTIPFAVDRIVRRLHEKERDRRHPRAEEAEEAIRTVLEAEKVGDPAELFRRFVADPVAFTAERNRARAADAASAAQRLLADAKAPREEALWAAYQTVSYDPRSPEAQSLFREVASRVGQRDGPVQNPRIRELEEEVRKDPDNVALLLQLAKLYRLEKDFLSVMRFFRRLRELEPKDPYVQGQITALVAPVAAPAGAAGARPAPAAPAPEVPGSRTGLYLAAAVCGVVLAAAVVWKAMSPEPGLVAPGPAERRAEALPRLGDGGGEGALGGAGSRPPSPDELLQKALEKGALLERDQGAKVAAAFYREALGSFTAPRARASLLLTLADASGRAGDADEALRALDEAATLGEGIHGRALLRKARLLETLRRNDEAGRIYAELVRTGEASARLPAMLGLALQADRAGDATQAVALYEEILARGPESPEANAARLGAAALYRAQGRREDARRLYEEARRRAAPGSDEEKSAVGGLASLD